MKNKIIYSTIALITIVSMSGCVTQKYNSPTLSFSADSLYRTLEATVDTSQNISQIPWVSFFSDTLLQQCIDSSLYYVSLLKNSEIAYSRLRVSQASFYPMVGAGQFSMNHNSFVTPQSYSSLSIGASWELDIWGKLSSANRSNKAKLMASEDGLQALQTNVIANTASLYYQLVTLDLEREVVFETIINRKQYLDTIRIMKQYGKVNEVAVKQAEAQLIEVQASLPNIELSIIQTENALNLLMLKPSGIITRVANFDFNHIKNISQIGYSSQLLKYRPDVRQAENNYRSAFELHNLSRAAMYPSVTLGVTGLLNNVFGAHITGLNALAALTAPLWNGRALRSQKEIAGFNLEHASIEFEVAVLTAAKEVSDAITKQTKTTEIIEKQQKLVVTYQQAYEYSLELFLNGYATYLDVLTAQTGVYSSEIQLLRSYFNNISSQIELYRSLGGGADKQLSEKELISKTKADIKAEKKQKKQREKEAKREAEKEAKINANNKE